MKRMLVSASTLIGVLLLSPALAGAHCDSLDGPVVKAARKALETGKLNPVLAWVQPGDEPAIKAAFDKTLAVRKLNPQARDLADTYFFETLVRIHRAGEGAPYTGLKPAGQNPGPAVAAADRAIEKGSVAEVEKLLTDTVRARLAEHFKAVSSKKAPGDDVAAGREWVHAYVPFFHYVEGVYAAAQAGGGHEPVGEAPAAATSCGHHSPASGHDKAGHEQAAGREMPAVHAH